MTFSPAHITRLAPNEVFVFGANTRGAHGAGAAKTARVKFGAEPGVGEGPTGQCYAIPTKDYNIQTLPLEAISFSVAQFLKYARQHPELTFLVTAIGCGLAGYSPKQIAPMFAGAPENVRLPVEFAMGH